MVGVGDGEGTKTVGVRDGFGFGVVDGDVVGGSVGFGAADEDVVEVPAGSGVVNGLGMGDRLGLAVLEGDGIGVPLGAAVGAGSAAQATRVNVRPTKNNAFLIVAFAFYNRRIAFSPQGVPGLWAHLRGFVASSEMLRSGAVSKGTCDQAYSRQEDHLPSSRLNSS